MTRPNVESLRDRNSALLVGLWLLRLVILMQCLGVGGKYYFSRHETESDIYGWLYFDAGWPEETAQHIDDLGALGSVVAGCVVVLGGLLVSYPVPSLGQRRSREVGRTLQGGASLAIAGWTLALASTHAVRGEIYAEWSLAEYAVRYSAPLGLLLLDRDGLTPVPRSLRRAGFAWLLLATAATFFLHGYKALQSYGPFTDLILLTAASWSDLEVQQTTAEALLRGIGIVDMMVAIALLSTRWRAIAWYMAFWGMLTAASRLTAFGVAAWPEMLIRSANWGAPLVVALLLIQPQPSRPTATPQVGRIQ